MSLDLEESPLSDSKMDISDSLESNAVSPEEVSEMNMAHSVAYNNSNINDDEAEQTEKPLLTLDNRISRAEVILDSIHKTNNFERTLANSHPLMSPTGGDSDSEEQNYMTLETNVKCQNFPDVVPCSERLQTTNVVSSTVLARNTLNRNSVHGKINAATTPTHNKLTMLRAHSPDLLSSESEADVSQYHASVESNFQTVALISNVRAEANNTQQQQQQEQLNHNNKLANGGILGCEDISSLDSISNHSFDDDDIEHNLASLSPSSSLMDGLADDENEHECGDPVDGVDCGYPEAHTPTPHQDTSVPVLSLPQYSAVEERRNSRNWQKITLPDGRVREIDMRVIEPYKRVLSHGGYLKAGGHNAIVMFCACHLPDHSRADYNYVMDNLFLYVVKTLEQLVTEDYVLIYLHGGSSRRNMPPFPWLKKCYQLLDHRLRKSLKNMYLVHPTFWIKSIVWMTRPFVSTKFWRKLVYVKSLEELSTHVAVERAAIPEKVKLYDAKLH